jgi:hypothetical protein
LGSRNQDNDQKNDMDFTFNNVGDYKKLDYISCWFYKASKFIFNTDFKYAFVTTNSITQGEQVPILWPLIFEFNQEIEFAHQSFKWTNNAKDNAGVAVVIIGIRTINFKEKSLYNQNIKFNVKNISPYLSNSPNIFVLPRSKSISNFPEMITGSSPCDDGNLIIDNNEKQKLVDEDKRIEPYLKKYVGAAYNFFCINLYYIFRDDLNTCKYQ